ncbi:MAG TPA: beta-ketoacyl synthase N-terminal-like domain-containing protein [Alphaproteobacteria bacterium]|jgi:3-oxoacyl-[acyl-carrier-protein] synthase II|nr:beta-ketoacyl synthase N-terminal-like domain-containing protein [Alphaproteobacteria bacterium]
MAARKEAGMAVAVTGIGIVTSLGRGRDVNWQKLTAGVSGIHRISRFPTEGLRTTIAGSVDFMDVRPIPPLLSYALAETAAAEALEQSGLPADAEFPGELFVAAPPLEHDWETRMALAHKLSAGPKDPYGLPGTPFTPNEDVRYAHVNYMGATLADHLAAKFRTQGSPITLTTACASGASAIQLGVEAIRRGNCRAALAVATDGSIQEEALIRFSLLSALSTKNEVPEKASKPFSKNRDGFVMAEGGAALVLEHPEAAKARGARILAYVRGCGEAADTFHRTRSNPNGLAIIRCIQGAVDDAGIPPEAVGYINAHGTGTPENDKMEYFAIDKVFGAHTQKLAVSSNKSMIGHTLTAAGAVEASFSILTILDGVLPPTINYDMPDPALPLDVVPNVARKAQPEYVLSNSFGFGGQNVSLVFGAAER